IRYKLFQSKIELIEIQAKSLQEVALFKLNSIKKKINGSYFVEDAGFFVDAPLNGFPGVYSSYVFKSIGNEGILKLIDDFDEPIAHFSAVIALYFKPLEIIFIFEGEIKGKVSKTIKGIGGFGFDPIFVPDVLKKITFAELSTEEKNEISHRGQALKKLLNFLKNN
ncbi:MAG TPA: RdgB/HAM1 family non-canonical purine NTP pyrophosphatase, partial [Candidatus Lokiarchaeia archaeon]